MTIDPSELIKRHRVEDGRKFNLGDVDPGDTCGLDIEKDDAKDMLETGISKLDKLQERLYAEGKWSILIVLQAMDAGGKDSAIEHVMTGVNPQGCNVRSFKAPGPTELKHDFLWRHAIALPERGKIGIFNRSHYEEVLVVRVHPEILENQNLPRELIGNNIWKQRFDDIRSFEQHLARSGTVLLKFYLHISKGEQKRRFLDRINEPDKNWKFSEGDIEERALWDDYMHAYEDMIRNTARKYAPWHVIPANNKWYARIAIAATLVEALERINPQFPELGEDAIAKMEEARRVLEADED